MPFISEKQKKFLMIKHPDIYKKWIKKYGGKTDKNKKTSSNPLSEALAE